MSLYYIYNYKHCIYHVPLWCSQLDRWFVKSETRVRISGQTKILKKYLVTPVNSKTIVRLSFI